MDRSTRTWTHNNDFTVHWLNLPGGERYSESVAVLQADPGSRRREPQYWLTTKAGHDPSRTELISQAQYLYYLAHPDGSWADDLMMEEIL